MSYLTVLPLADVKTYLRIDDTQNETDAEITSMINAAFRYIEKHTNIIVVQQATKEYTVRNSCVDIHDYPINSVVKGIDEDGNDVTLTFQTNYDKVERTNYTTYYNIDVDAVKLVLDVGYTVPANVPDDIIEVAKVMVKVMYYEQESNQSFNEMLPQWAKSLLHSSKRHII